MFIFRKLRNFIGGGFCVVGGMFVDFGSMIQVSIDDRYNAFISAYPSLSPVKKEESKETLSIGSTIFLLLAKHFSFKTHFQDTWLCIELKCTCTKTHLDQGKICCSYPNSFVLNKKLLFITQFAVDPWPKSDNPLQKIWDLSKIGNLKKYLP